MRSLLPRLSNTFYLQKVIEVKLLGLNIRDNDGGWKRTKRRRQTAEHTGQSLTSRYDGNLTRVSVCASEPDSESAEHAEERCYNCGAFCLSFPEECEAGGEGSRADYYAKHVNCTVEVDASLMKSCCQSGDEQGGSHHTNVGGSN